MVTKHIYKKSFNNIVFFSVFTMFSVKNTVIYTFFGIKSVQNTGSCSVFNALASKKLSIPLSPQTLENTAIYTVFFNFSMPLANSNYTNNPSKPFFFQCFYNVFRQKHRNLHVFRHKVGPKQWFLQCFQCSGIQKPFKISLFTVFFHFCPFFHCWKPTKMMQNSISIPS